MPGLTPIYGIKYLLQGEPAFTTRQVMEDNARTVEAALAARGVIPPGASDLAGLLGRLAVIESPPVYRFRRTAAQVIPNNAFTSLQWDTRVEEPNLATDGPAWVAATNPSRITVKRSGLYRVSAGYCMPANVSCRRGVHVLVNGVATFAGAIQYGAGVDIGIQCDDIIRVNAGQYVEVQAFQDSGANQNTGNPDYSPSFCALNWIRP